jgi:hypothetical protein
MNITDSDLEFQKQSFEMLKLAFQYAGDLSKQLITLSIGILTISITFTKDLVKDFDSRHKKWLALSWSFLFVSIIFGIWSLMALTGSIDNYKTLIKELSTKNIIIDCNARVPAGIQILSFLAGVIFLIGFGLKTFSAKKQDPNP